jgi:hypothetical protein
MSKFRRCLVFQILTKWGEYSNDVQFILQWSSFDGIKQELPARLKIADTQHGFSHGPSSPPATPHDAMSPPDRNKDIRKSLTFSGGHHVGRTGDNVGVVKARPRLEVCRSYWRRCECGEGLTAVLGMLVILETVWVWWMLDHSYRYVSHTGDSVGVVKT